LLVDRSGVYRGSRLACPAGEVEPWEPAVTNALRVAHVLQEKGYFGPLGIDAMQYRDGSGQIRVRPLQDLNARHTMGRLALEFRRVVPEGWCACWLHPGVAQTQGNSVDLWLAEVARRVPSGVRVVPTSPVANASAGPERLAVLVLAPTTESLR